jgi:SAM-dependent methyltransferase
MDMYWRRVVVGGLSLVPGFNEVTRRDRRTGTGGTNSARYCYDVWMKHLTLARANGLPGVPQTIAELGPGDSIGTGLAAMLCGASHYFALDIIEHANVQENVKVFDELVTLFEARAGRSTPGWPDFDVHLDDGLFPGHILSPDLLRHSLAPDRVAAIRRRIQDPGANTEDLSLRYMAPWQSPSVVRPGNVDFILSHACLEHVDDIDATCEAMALWLRPGGFMSHQIDFTDHGLARRWNGYRTCPEWAWRLARGKGSFLINRAPPSAHLAAMQRHGFDIVCDMRFRQSRNSVKRTELARRWTALDDNDLFCSGAFVQARKRLAS